MLMILAGVNQMKRAFVCLLLMVVASAFAGDKPTKAKPADWTTQFERERLIVISRESEILKRLDLPIDPLILIMCDRESGDRLYLSLNGRPGSLHEIAAIAVSPGGCKP